MDIQHFSTYYVLLSSYCLTLLPKQKQPPIEFAVYPEEASTKRSATVIHIHSLVRRTTNEARDQDGE